MLLINLVPSDLFFKHFTLLVFLFLFESTVFLFFSLYLYNKTTEFFLKFFTFTFAFFSSIDVKYSM